MKQMKAVAKKMKDQNALIERIRGDIARCNDTIARGAGSDGRSEIGALREKRRKSPLKLTLSARSPTRRKSMRKSRSSLPSARNGNRKLCPSVLTASG